MARTGWLHLFFLALYFVDVIIAHRAPRPTTPKQKTSDETQVYSAEWHEYILCEYAAVHPFREFSDSEFAQVQSKYITAHERIARVEELEATYSEELLERMKQLAEDATVLLNEIAIEVVPGTDVKALAKEKNWTYLFHSGGNFHLVRVGDDQTKTYFNVEKIKIAEDTRITAYQQGHSNMYEEGPMTAYPIYLDPIDPFYPAQLQSNLGNDVLNVPGAWNKYHVSGAGIQVGIVDIGVQEDHPDYKYNKSASLNIETNTPDQNLADNDSHGTCCAGIVAATTNKIGSVGIAYNATIASLNIKGSKSVQEKAKAATYHPQSTSVYSISYSMGIKGELDMKNIKGAFSIAADEGRGGKGSIIVIANGNRHAFPGFFSSNYNSLVSPYVISVTSTNLGIFRTIYV